jgi:hypothetical protein
MISGEWWIGLDGASKVFWMISIVFSILFFIQFVMSLFGIDFLGDTETDGTKDSGYSIEGDFALFSVRSIIAFFTFFGWTGVLVLGKGSSIWIALFFALLAGAAAMFLVAYLFLLFHKLTKSENTDVYQALFTTAEVYIPIPEHRKGSGKVHILLGNALREMEAVTEGERLPTGKKVKVVEIINKQTLVVIPLETFDSF